MARTCQPIEISLKMRNRFLRRLRGGRTKRAAQSPKLCAEFIFHLFRNVCLCYLASVQRKRIGYRPFQLPAYDETLHRQRTELEFGSYHYPVNSLSPCHKGLVYGAHLKYITESKKHISIINTRGWKEYISSHIECTFIQEVLIGFSGQMHFFLIIYRPDRACGDKSVDLIDLVH